MPAKKYLRETEPAVKHMFAALDHYIKLNPHRQEHKRRNGSGGARKEVIKYLSRGIDASGLDMAKATLCGAIVNVAYTGIKQFSRNNIIPVSCENLEIPLGCDNTKFCVGRDIHGVPLGLLVFAAREQFGNWEEGTPSNPTAKGVFEHLRAVRKKNIWQDLIYELDWPTKRPVSHHVMQQDLNWHTYEDYIKDMQHVLLF